MRVASLVPSATDLVASLGLAEHLVGVSHECDHPAARGKPVLTRSGVPAAPATAPAEVDRQVSEAVAEGRSLYVADRAGLAALRPDVVLSQDVCDVCAVEGSAAHAALPEGARLVMLSATSVTGLFEDLSRVAGALDALEAGERAAAGLRARLDAVRRRADGTRALTLEWSDPPFLGGHWVPELVAWVGGVDAMSAPGAPSRRSSYEELRAAEFDLAVFMPCGYALDEAAAEAEVSEALRALGCPVWATDATRLFSRCTPEAVAAGAECLAAILAGQAPAPEAARRVHPRVC
jgi:iron complex transport system substrate-binding protein